MKKIFTLLALSVFSVYAMSQYDEPAKKTHIIDGLSSVAAIAGETKTAEDSIVDTKVEPVPEIPIWKQKLYYGYNFDIYYHDDSRNNTREKGWSISITPEIGWRVNEKVHMGMRLGGTYSSTRAEYAVATSGKETTYTSLRIQQGSWEVTPYARYRLKTLFDGRIGVWIEAHLYAGMSYPRVADEDLESIKGTDYDGLRCSATYGAQISPVITYQFNKKSTFQIFFSILSLGYSGTTYCYTDPIDGHRYNEYTNDVILFSGKLRNLIANQFTPGLYGLKFGVQKSF